MPHNTEVNHRPVGEKKRRGNFIVKRRITTVSRVRHVTHSQPREHYPHKPVSARKKKGRRHETGPNVGACNARMQTKGTNISGAANGILAVGQSRLVSLPLEIRELVIQYLIADRSPVIVLPDKVSKNEFCVVPSRFLPSLAFVNKSLFYEVVLVRLRAHVVLTAFNNSRFYQFLRRTTKGMGFKNIRSLEFQHRLQQYAPREGDLHGRGNFIHDFVLRCPALRTLVLKIDMFTLIESKPGYTWGRDFSSKYNLWTVARIEEDFQLARLLEKKGKFSLKLVLLDRNRFRKAFRLTREEIFGPFIDALRLEAKARGCAMNIEIHYEKQDKE